MNKMTQKSYELLLTREQIKCLLENLEQCESEGYLKYGDPSYSVMQTLIEIVENEKDNWYRQLLDLKNDSELAKKITDSIGYAGEDFTGYDGY